MMLFYLSRSALFAGGLSSMRFSRFQAAWPKCLAVAMAASCLLAGSPAFGQQRQRDPLDQDFPFQTACISARFPAGNTVNKGLTIKLGNDAYVVFDTDLLRMAAGWTGDYLDFRGVAFSGDHGMHPSIAGDQKFGCPPVPGVADASGSFADARPEPFGPMPASQGRWVGLYLQGDNVVLSYTVGKTKILEMPASATAEGLVGFARNFRIERAQNPIEIMLCEVADATAEVKANRATLAGRDGTVTIAELAGAPSGASLAVVDQSRLVLKLPASTGASAFKVVLWKGAAAGQSKFAGLLAGDARVADIKAKSPPRWAEQVVTKGVLNFNHSPDGAYAVDQVTPPLDNPWHRRVRFSAFDFFPDGHSAAVSTWDGDIWIVTGIDGELGKLTWHRFSSGQYETLGLKIVDGIIYTSGRDQITRYHDLDGNGEADFYENFNNQVTSSSGFHEFVLDLQTDPEGNFYFAKAGPVRAGGRGFGGDNFGTISACAGTLMKVSKDGGKLEVVATGLRVPNGISVGPRGELTTTDNEGTWVPQCPINWIEKDGFYGVKDTAHRSPVPERNPPLCWLDFADIDNSGGGQVWVTSDKWGPFAGDLLHLSYGRCALYLVMKEKVGGIMQGGVVRIPVSFSSSAMRGRFNNADGQLYVAGLQGWQTTAVRLSGFDRVRYTGKPIRSASGIHFGHDSVTLAFTEPLDPASANDIENYSSKRWNYLPKEDNYGAYEISVADPKKRGRDVVDIRSVKLSPDGKTVTLQFADLKPVQTMSIKYNLKAKDGAEFSQDVQFTINKLP